jgi:hypothetical protein
MNAVLIGEPDAEIVALESDLRAAQLAADANALDRLIADELLFTGPDGSVGTKEQDLAAHRSGAVRFRAHEPEELRIRRVGADVAVTARDSLWKLAESSLEARTATPVCGRGSALVSGAWSVAT